MEESLPGVKPLENDQGVEYARLELGELNGSVGKGLGSCHHPNIVGNNLDDENP